MSAMAAFATLLSLQAPFDAEAAEVLQPRTLVELTLVEADRAVADAEQFTCASQSRRDHQEIEALRTHYARLLVELEQRLGRRPFENPASSDCRVLDRADYWAAVHRATMHLNRAERMVRRGETN